MQLAWTSLVLVFAFGYGEASLFPGIRADVRYEKLQELLFTQTFKMSGNSASSFYLSTFYLPRYEAKQACEALGATLAEITRRATFNMINNWLESLHPYDGQMILIGGTWNGTDYTYDLNMDSAYLWFHSGEPSQINSNGDSEDCLAMERRNGVFRMNDVICSKNFQTRFLCYKTI